MFLFLFQTYVKIQRENTTTDSDQWKFDKTSSAITVPYLRLRAIKDLRFKLQIILVSKQRLSSPLLVLELITFTYRSVKKNWNH